MKIPGASDYRYGRFARETHIVMAARTRANRRDDTTTKFPRETPRLAASSISRKVREARHETELDARATSYELALEVSAVELEFEPLGVRSSRSSPRRTLASRFDTVNRAVNNDRTLAIHSMIQRSSRVESR